MSFKLNLSHLVGIVIILCIIYFVLQYRRDKKMEEGFTNEIPENTNDRNYYSTNQSNSTYYPLQVDKNDVEDVDKVKSLFKKLNITSIQDLFHSITNLVHLDKWTGYWRNFNDTTTETSSGIFMQDVSGIDSTKDNILVLRKVQDNIFFSLTRRAYLQNTYNNISNLPYSRYMFVGRAQIDSSDSNKANIVEIYQDTYNQATDTKTLDDSRKGDIRFIPKSEAETNDKITFTFNSNTITSFTKRNALPKGVTNHSETIPYYFYESTATVFTDLQCPPDKEKCSFTLPNAQNPNTYQGCIQKGGSTNGNCTITQNSDICYLDNLITNEIINYPLGNGLNKSISKCDPNYYPLQNNSDYMINKFLSGNKQCPSYLSDLTSSTSNTTYLVYYLYDTNNIVDLGYQVWGLGSHDSKLTTQKTILSNLLYQYMTNNTGFKDFVKTQLNMNTFNEIKDFKTISTINENTANNMITWKVDKLYNNSPSCFFKLSSKSTSKKSNYFVHYDNTKGTVGVSVLSGGNKNALMISNQDKFSSANGNVNVYMGYLKNTSLFISPGSSVEQELNPFMGTQTNVCSLVSKMNVQGKWLIMKINPPSQKTFLDVLKGTA